MTSPPRILVVEDDESLRLALEDNLDAEGYAVEVAADGLAARAAIARGGHDLVVLDVMLPGVDGYTLARELRARPGAQPKILMLTARSLEDDVVRGLELGADDYLTKPYRLRELLARIKVLLRRGEAAATPVPAPPPPADDAPAIPGVRIDPRARTVHLADGSPVELTRTELDLLLFLWKRRGEALSRDQILDAVWGEAVMVDERTVDNFVSNLKKKLGWSSGAGWSIKSVRGVGYRFDLG